MVPASSVCCPQRVCSWNLSPFELNLTVALLHARYLVLFLAGLFSFTGPLRPRSEWMDRSDGWTEVTLREAEISFSQSRHRHTAGQGENNHPGQHRGEDRRGQGARGNNQKTWFTVLKGGRQKRALGVPASAFRNNGNFCGRRQPVPFPFTNQFHLGLCEQRVHVKIKRPLC